MKKLLFFSVIFYITATVADSKPNPGILYEYRGIYDTYPDDQKKVNALIPDKIKISYISGMEVKGGAKVIVLEFFYKTEKYKVKGTYKELKRRIYGYTIVKGNGFRFSIKPYETRAAYDLHCQFTFYSGESAVERGRGKFSYRRYRR